MNFEELSITRYVYISLVYSKIYVISSLQIVSAGRQHLPKSILMPQCDSEWKKLSSFCFKFRFPDNRVRIPRIFPVSTNIVWLSCWHLQCDRIVIWWFIESNHTHTLTHQNQRQEAFKGLPFGAHLSSRARNCTPRRGVTQGSNKSKEKSKVNNTTSSPVSSPIPHKNQPPVKSQFSTLRQPQWLCGTVAGAGEEWKN